MSEVGRHRVVRPEDFAALRPDDLEARLLGKPATMARRDVSRGAEVSLLSARKFWHALGFPNVEDDDAMFTEADQMALMATARLVREWVAQKRVSVDWDRFSPMRFQSDSTRTASAKNSSR